MKNFINLLIIVFVFSISFFSLYSTEIEVFIVEDATSTKLLSGSYSLDVDGVIELHNPSNVSKVYEYSIPLNLDSLIGISQESVDNTSSNFDFSFDRIKGYLLGPNETIRTGYNIYGLVSYDVFSKVSQNESVLEYYSDFEFVPKAVLSLQKPEREGIRYNEDGSLNNSEGENTSKRLVTAGIRNPTDFLLDVENVNIYATTADDPMFKSGSLLTSFTNLSLLPFAFRELDFFDPSSVNNSVYWISSKFLIQTDINTSLIRTSKEQKRSSGGGGGSSGGGGGGSFGSPADEVNLSETVLIKKSVDKTVVRSGDEFIVYLTIVNIGDSSFENLQVTDEIPSGYEVKDISLEAKISNSLLEFTIDELEGYSSKVISYTLSNNNGISGITYLKPAELVYDSETLFSEGVLVINDLLPDKKVFVQKEVDIVDDTFARVTLRVRNLGSISIDDLLVTDDIPEDVIVKEISQIFFERGSWRINTLLPGEEWEVSYLVERNPTLDNLPKVFGIEQENVYGTLISSAEIVTIFQEKPRTIEKVGLVVSVGLLIFYLLF
ncbi:MAG: hypothetical protein VX028_00525 [Nanoarchaeota archaeon]|nr:hypothetical protein [Nanoarchaeota archaeon]